MMNNYEFTRLYGELRNSTYSDTDLYGTFKAYKMAFFVKEFIEREKKHDMSKTYKVMLSSPNKGFKAAFAVVYKWLKDEGPYKYDRILTFGRKLGFGKNDIEYLLFKAPAFVGLNCPFYLKDFNLGIVIGYRRFVERIWEVPGFEEALSHGFEGYECHHLFETKCPVYHPYASDLKKWNLYYNREDPKEFIFLTRSDHRKLHAEFPQTKFKKLKDKDLWERFPVEEDGLDFYELDQIISTN